MMRLWLLAITACGLVLPAQTFNMASMGPRGIQTRRLASVSSAQKEGLGRVGRLQLRGPVMQAAAVGDIEGGVGGSQDLDGPFDDDAFRQGFRICGTEEAAYEAPCTEGKVPADLRGTLFRNGHARFQDRAGNPIRHEFDGDGMVSAFTFEEGRVVARSRWVKTEMELAEKEAKQSLFTRTFGNPKPFWAGGASIKNVANTGVVAFKDKLFALWEGGRPHEMDPVSLETVGESTLDGLLGSGPTDSFAAHPRRDPKTKALVNFAYFGDPINGNTPVKFWEFDEAETARAGERFPLRQPVREATVPGFGMLHDMLVSDSYFILLNAPVRFAGEGMDKLKRIFKWVKGEVSVGSLLEYLGGATNAHFVPRKGGKTINVQLDEFFAFHHANAHEQGDVVIVETTCYDMSPNKGVGFLDPNPKPGMTRIDQMDVKEWIPAFLYRYTINLKTGAFEKKLLCKRPAEFPMINPKYAGSYNRYTYALTSNPAGGKAPMAHALLKVDGEDESKTRVWMPPAHQFCQEPLFVPRDGATEEDDGYLLLNIFDGKKLASELLVFDARSIEAGPLSRTQLRSPIPFGLHGTWVQGQCPSLEDVRASESKGVFLGND